jgi:hypothetical protein
VPGLAAEPAVDRLTVSQHTKRTEQLDR